MSLQLSGLNTLAYKGVEASQPPQLLYMSRRPTSSDNKGVNVGTFWLYNPTNAEELWILLSLNGGTATWVQLYPAQGGGTGANQFITDSGTANQLAGVLNILGDGDIVSSGAGNTVTLSFTKDFAEFFVTDNGTATAIADTLNITTNNSLSGAGNTVKFSGTSNTVKLEVSDANSNTAVGYNAGGFTPMVGTGNTLYGDTANTVLTTGSFNTVVGAVAGYISSGSYNTIVGEEAGGAISSGSYNTIIGRRAGNDCTTGTESSNIYIGNIGSNGESNTIRIGTQGVGAGQQDKAYMAGVYQAPIGGINEFVKIDNTGKLGTGTVPVGGDGLLFVQSQDVAGLTEVTFTIPDGYYNARVIFNNLTPPNTGILGSGFAVQLHYSNNNGVSYTTSDSYSGWFANTNPPSITYTPLVPLSAFYYNIIDGVYWDENNCNGYIDLYNLLATPGDALKIRQSAQSVFFNKNRSGYLATLIPQGLAPNTRITNIKFVNDPAVAYLTGRYSLYMYYN